MSKTVNSKPTKKCDYMAKVIVLGNSSVGKTSILTRYTWNGDQGEYKLCHTPTIGLDFKTKTVKHQNKLVKLQLWDTAGQQRFRTITDNYYSGVSGIILVYSVSDRKSFEQINDWIIKINTKADQNVPKIIVANKCEIGRRNSSSQQNQSRAVETHQGMMLAKEHNAMFLEVSAKQNINIEQAFTMLVANMMHQLEEKKNMAESSIMIMNKKENNNRISHKKQEGCCQ